MKNTVKFVILAAIASILAPIVACYIFSLFSDSHTPPLIVVIAAGIAGAVSFTASGRVFLWWLTSEEILFITKDTKLTLKDGK